MLSADQVRRVRILCKQYNLGMLEVQDSGLLHFTSNRPIKEKIEKHLLEFEITFSGDGPTMDNRPDDMRWAYWVTARPTWLND